jgi:Enoyl-CoA hydratase/isomerase
VAVTNPQIKDAQMPEVVTERVENILRIRFNRPEKKNAMTSSMYSTVAELLNAAAKEHETRVVLLHGAGDAFSAGNDLGDFLHNPPKSDDSPEARFLAALIDFDKPLIAEIPDAFRESRPGARAGNERFASCADRLPRRGGVDSPGTAVRCTPGRGAGARHARRGRGGPHDNGSRHGTPTDTTAGRGRPREQAADEACLGRPNGRRCPTRVPEVRVRLQSDEAKEALTAFFEKRRPDFTKFTATA